MRLVVLCTLLLVGCRGPEQAAAIHEDPTLAVYPGERAQVETDLPPDEAQAAAVEVGLLEQILDTAFPFLAPPAQPGRTLLVADAARFALLAQDHDVSEEAGAFVCDQGEVVVRRRPQVEGPPYPTEPRVRPLAAALFRRRLLGSLGADLQPTWLEEGLTQVFVELAAHEQGDAALAVRRARESLLDAYLPLFLGGEPTLARLASARGRRKMQRTGDEATAWAAIRFLLNDSTRVPLLEACLTDAAGRLPPEVWEATHTRASS